MSNNITQQQAEICKGHKPKILSYMAFFRWCEKQKESGKQQLQCSKCFHFLWPSEWGTVKPNPHKPNNQ